MVIVIKHASHIEEWISDLGHEPEYVYSAVLESSIDSDCVQSSNEDKSFHTPISISSALAMQNISRPQ